MNYMFLTNNPSVTWWNRQRSLFTKERMWYVIVVFRDGKLLRHSQETAVKTLSHKSMGDVTAGTPHLLYAVYFCVVNAVERVSVIFRALQKKYMTQLWIHQMFPEKIWCLVCNQMCYFFRLKEANFSLLVLLVIYQLFFIRSRHF